MHSIACSTIKTTLKWLQPEDRAQYPLSKKILAALQLVNSGHSAG